MNTAFSQSDIVAGLHGLGLKAGDAVLLHSSLSSIGQVDGGAATVVTAFLEVLGSEGTLLVPTFGSLGVIPETVKRHHRAIQSVHPMASVAAIGKQAEALCRDHWKPAMAHERDTPYTRLAELGGYVMLLGVDQDRNTTLHTVEEILRAPYLSTTREVTVQTPEGPVTRSWTFFPGPHRDFIGCDALLRASGKMRVAHIGKAVVRLIRSRDLIDVVLAHAREHPDWALCQNANCLDCVKQRAALTRDRLKQETFRVAASARLAGRYVPEMVENLKAAGLDAVEVDWIQGEPAFRLPRARLERVRAEFDDAGIAVSGLRAALVTDDLQPILDAARALGVDRLLLPLTARGDETVRLVRHAGVEVSFFNQSTGSGIASQWLEAMTTADTRPRFAFNAANFARVGESPFLRSFRQRLKKHIDQLDVEDVTRDGEPQMLAAGQAEIKELVSVLRCAAFAGWMVLGAGNAATGGLRETAQRFVRLLDSM